MKTNFGKIKYYLYYFRIKHIYHSTNRLRPSLKLVDGLYAKSFSNALVSAYVIGTSPFCIGTSFMCFCMSKSFDSTLALVSSSVKMLTKSFNVFNVL